MIEAPPDRVFISPDLPQADARIVAWDAQCLPMIKVLSDPNRHLHLETCRMLFGHEITKGTEEYRQGKAMLHAANYRMAPKRLAMELGIPVCEAKRLLARYFSIYPEIQQWHISIRERIKSLGYLETPRPFKRQRLLYSGMAELINTGELSTETWNSACSWIPQSAVADIINWGLMKLKEQLHDEIWLHKHDHDSFLASISPAGFKSAISTALVSLRIPLLIHGRYLVMEPEMSYGQNYGAMIRWQGEDQPDVTRMGAELARKLDPETLRKELYGYI